jgi:hypothetical protein
MNSSGDNAAREMARKFAQLSPDAAETLPPDARDVGFSGFFDEISNVQQTANGLVAGSEGLERLGRTALPIELNEDRELEMPLDEAFALPQSSENAGNFAEPRPFSPSAFAQRLPRSGRASRAERIRFLGVLAAAVVFAAAAGVAAASCRGES